MREDIEPFVDEIERGLSAPDKTLAAISAAALQSKTLPPLREIVPELIVQGLTIIGSPPKYGKSWMVLDLCLSVSTGTPFLGFPTRSCGCLYLALEDSERRLKNRLGKLLDGGQAPENFYFATSASSTDTGLFEELNRFRVDHPDVGLIVIDTLQKVRGSSYGRDGSYAADYREMGELKSFADRENLAVVVVHHLRKMSDDADPFNRISGTAAVSGAADSMVVLTREKRGADTTTLTATGRDIDSVSLELSFDTDSCRWRNLGDTEQLRAKRAFEDYDKNPVVVTLRCLIGKSTDSRWIGRAGELMNAGRRFVGEELALSNQALAAELSRLEPQLLQYDSLVHQVMSGGTGGKRHLIAYRP
ncbi:MAG: AAA family ATPase [Oscillospiraceae bacterium]|nr:AAA family ATPase [Oscillospiraceae bacterium]